MTYQWGSNQEWEKTPYAQMLKNGMPKPAAAAPAQATAAPKSSGTVALANGAYRGADGNPYYSYKGMSFTPDMVDRMKGAGMLDGWQKPAADLNMYGLGQGSAAAGQAGSYTANSGITAPQAPAYQPQRIDYDSRRNQLNELRGLANFDPYKQGGQAHTAALNSAYSRPSGMLQNALQNTQRAAAERGITQRSGLAQEQQNQNRNEAAKMAAQLGGQVDQDFAIRSAEQQERNRGFLADLARLESNLGSVDFNNQLAAARLAMQQDEQMYGRRNDSWRDPLARAGAELGLAGQQAQFDYLRPTLEQQYQGRQQGLTAGGLSLDAQQRLQDPQIRAELARLGLSEADAKAMLYATEQEDQFQRSGLGQFYANYDRAQRNPIQRDVNNAIGQIQQTGMSLLGLGAGGGFGGTQQSAPVRLNSPSTLGVQWPY